MENEQTYYFITVFARLDETSLRNYRTWGFYKNFNNAVATVRNNITDLWETIYDYAVIEEYHEGISGYAWHRWFFKYNEELDEYQLIDEPTECAHYCSFALG